MGKKLNTEEFWEKRLSNNLNLRATGHRAFSLEYNYWLYQAQLDTLELAFANNKIEVNNKPLLDIGSGGGFFVDFLKKKGGSPITGVDITASSVDHLKRNFAECTFYHADISFQQLPFNDKFYLVLAMSVLFHIVDEAGFEQAVNNICASINPGGYLLLCDKLHRSWIPEVAHVKTRDLKSYLPIFHQHGVEVVEILPIYYFLNRVYVPVVMPWIINRLGLGKVFYQLDTKLRKNHCPNLGEMKLLVAKKK